MKIREAVADDIPSIVSLLKLSLGEGLMPKSESYWRWKHIDNPFGKSPVLVAEEDDTLIGVRAFMRWGWHADGNTITAVRAVDTATHPDFQGKGIFRKLTMELVEHCKQQGVHFIFNTPNKQSMPGYLKMGWQNAGRLPIRFHPVFPFTGWGKTSEIEPIKFLSWIDDASDKEYRSNSLLQTLKTKEFLKWRYGTVPVATYEVLDNGNEIVIFRVKKNSWGTEFRITDVFSENGMITDFLRNQLMIQARIAGSRVITSSGTFSIGGGIVLNRGPFVTIRNLNYSDFSDLMGFKKWGATIGDMELF